MWPALACAVAVVAALVASGGVDGTAAGFAAERGQIGGRSVVLAARTAQGAAAVGAVGASAARPGRQLPQAAAGPVSRILGDMAPGYQVSRDGGALVARDRGQRLLARFTAAGVTVDSGLVSVQLRLRGLGYGARLAAVRAVPPAADANRVVYRTGRLTQWYANGPMGLEQGFTVPAPPPGAVRGRDQLTLSLAVSGGSRLRLAAGGVVFSRAGSALAYRDLVVTDARGRQLPARISVAAGQLLVHADVRSARYPVTIDPVFQQLAKLTLTNGVYGGYGGYSLASAGNTVVAGSGDSAAYVFTEPGTGWANETQAAELTAPGGDPNGDLGLSVAISASGTTVVAGAPDIGPDNEPGAAYVFTEPPTGWANETPSAELTASDGAGNDQFGSAVAVSGSTVVVGAADATIGLNTAQGAAYVFTEPGGGWASQPVQTQVAKLTASDGVTRSMLGASVAISGTTVVAGAPDSFIFGQGDNDAAYVFTEPIGGWASRPHETQAAELTASDGAAGDFLGTSVAIDGSTVVAGAPDAAIGSNGQQGAAYVFTEPGSGWASQPDEIQIAKLTASDGAASDAFGSSVAIAGSTVVAGAPAATINSNSEQGAAYVFTEPAGGWASQPAQTQSAKLTASDGGPVDSLGHAVAVTGTTVVAAAPFASFGGIDYQGAIYVFGTPPPEVHLVLGGVIAPGQGSQWRRGSAVTVAVAVHYAGGPAIPGSLAAELASDCDVTVRARGAQSLATRCMSYHAATGTFSYRWQLRAPGSGKVGIGIQLSYRSVVSSQWRFITIRR